MVKSEERKIPLKNYILLGVVIIVSLFLLYYFYLWYMAYEESKLSKPIMDRYMQVINYNEMDSYIAENKKAIVYVSVLENEEIRNFEIKFNKAINELGFKNKMLYLDLTYITYDPVTYNEAVSKYSVNGKNIANYPCVMLFLEGKLVEIYDLKANDYNIENLTLYLEDKGIDTND